MTHKTINIKGCKTCNEVHIFLDRNNNGEDFVRLLAWHNIKDGLIIQSGEVDVCKSDKDNLMMRRYIADFSEISANEFANNFSF
jgi:hypothetical protein